MVDSVYIDKLENEGKDIHIVVLGDVMIDRYIYGTVERMSPEAPVPILVFDREENRLGGAANIVLNLLEMACKVSLLSVIGNDSDGAFLTKEIESKNLNYHNLISENNRLTTVKTRYMNKDKQTLRVDKEITKGVLAETEDAIISSLSKISSQSKIDVLILEDYNKGLLTETLIQKILDFCKKKGIKVCVDPKKSNFFKYSPVYFFKPNLKEVKEALGLSSTEESLEKIMSKLAEKIEAELIFITLAEKGIILKDKSGIKLVPTRQIEVKDVAGAGDTVIALAAMCIALHMQSSIIAEICNWAGGQVCEQAGVVSVKKDKLLSDLRQQSL